MAPAKESHLERTATEPREAMLLDTTLGQVEQVNERIRLIRLDLSSGPTKFLPGQWLDTYVPDSPKAGGFTITSPPSTAEAKAGQLTPPFLELAIQVSPENPPAAWLWRPASEILGSTVRVRIGGSFVFPPAGADAAPMSKVVLVAGGVGVNPLMSMLSHIAHTEDRTRVEFLYATKLPEGGVDEVLFFKRIAALFRENKVEGTFKLFITGKRESSTLDSHDSACEINRGRISQGTLKEAIGQDTASTIVYICGPPSMTDNFTDCLTKGPRAVMEPGRVITEKWW